MLILNTCGLQIRTNIFARIIPHKQIRTKQICINKSAQTNPHKQIRTKQTSPYSLGFVAENLVEKCVFYTKF